MRADLAVIGAGPGGYVAALRGAQLGAQVVLVEKATIGGVCLNWGCIPTKTLLRSAEVLRLARGAKDYGLVVEGVGLDWQAVLARKDRVVGRLTKGVEQLLRRAGIQIVIGEASFTSPTQLEIRRADEVQTVEASRVIIATGSSPVGLPIEGLSGRGVLSSDRAVAIEELPDAMLIVGGGPVGVEFATLFQACGVQVALVELLDRLLPGLDRDLSEEVTRSLKKMKVKLHTGSRVVRADSLGEERHKITVEGASGTFEVEAATVLLAVGRRANVDGLALEQAGVQLQRGVVGVDKALRTSAPHIYAVGDVTGGQQLAHVAMQEGTVAAENALGGQRDMEYDAIPSCVFSWPEVSTVGLSESQAVEKGYQVETGRFPYRANGKALAYGERDGFVKLVCNAADGRLLGVHIAGAHASDLIQEATLALKLGLTVDVLEGLVHPHPTFTEAVGEAALAVHGRAIHG